MANTQRYNFPDKDDPQFADKVVDLLRVLFDKSDAPARNFSPSQTPVDLRQIGDQYFDSSDEKMKVVTSSGIKILKYE